MLPPGPSNLVNKDVITVQQSRKNKILKTKPGFKNIARSGYSNARASLVGNTNKCIIVRSHEPSTLHLSSHNNAEHFFGFYLQVCHQAAPPQWVDCLGQMRNKRKVFFPKVQQCIASSEIEPGVRNFSMTSPMLNQLSYRCRHHR